MHLIESKQDNIEMELKHENIEMEQNQINIRTFSYNHALNENVNVNTIDKNINYYKEKLQELINHKETITINKLHDNAYEIDPKSDKLCSWLQIFTSCFSSFSHGSNDVANAIAPLATIYSIYQTNTISDNSPVPIWILALGGAGIILGLSTWGYKIINRIGRELTKISPSRGFIIELAAATTIIIASRAEIPISTTHCQIGSVVGCGLSNGLKNIQWKLFKGILWSWFITLPITGLLSASLFSYGYYAPSEFTNNATFIH